MSEEQWNPNGESYDFALDQYAIRLSRIIQKELTSYGMQIDKNEASRLAKKWLYELEAEKPEEVLNLLSADSTAEILSHSIVENILLNIAEERPGTNPWKHEDNIPIPLHLAIAQISTLSLAAAVSITNSDAVWAENSHASIIAASNYIANKVGKGEVHQEEITIFVNDTPKEYYGSIIYLPQPAVAYLARFFENIIMRIVEQGWIIPSEIMSWTEAIATLKIQSDMLRHLNKTYGKTGSAGPNS